MCVVFFQSSYINVLTREKEILCMLVAPFTYSLHHRLISDQYIEKNSKICAHTYTKHIHHCNFLIISGNGEVIQYHIFNSVVVIELSV